MFVRPDSISCLCLYGVITLRVVRNLDSRSARHVARSGVAGRGNSYALPHFPPLFSHLWRVSEWFGPEKGEMHTSVHSSGLHDE